MASQMQLVLSIIELFLSIVSIVGAFYFVKVAFAKPQSGPKGFPSLCLEDMSKTKQTVLKVAAVLVCVQLAFAIVNGLYGLMHGGKVSVGPMSATLASAFR